MEPDHGVTLLPAEVTTAKQPAEEPEHAAKPSEELDLKAVLAKLKQIGGKSE
jgi:hypothetical protein